MTYLACDTVITTVSSSRKDSTRSDATAGSSMLFSAEAALESKRAGER